MEQAYTYLVLSGALTLLLWTPYILCRLFVWGLPTFLNNYPESFPAKEPEVPLWAERAKRAHLNMVETMPAFIAVVVGADLLGAGAQGVLIGSLAQAFFLSRILHAVVYTAGIPYLRTPSYLIGWAAILWMAAVALG